MPDPTPFGGLKLHSYMEQAPWSQEIGVKNSYTPAEAN